MVRSPAPTIPPPSSTTPQPPGPPPRAPATRASSIEISINDGTLVSYLFLCYHAATLLRLHTCQTRAHRKFPANASPKSSPAPGLHPGARQKPGLREGVFPLTVQLFPLPRPM